MYQEPFLETNIKILRMSFQLLNILQPYVIGKINETSRYSLNKFDIKN